MKTAVVFFSRTGTTEKIAARIAKELNGDLLPIKSNLYPMGLRGYFRAVRHAFSRDLTPIETGGMTLDQYDLVVVGSPVWGGNVSAPIRSFLVKNNHKFKKVAYFINCGGTSSEKPLNKMIEFGHKTPVAKLGIKGEDFVRGEYEVKVLNFIRKIHDKFPERDIHPAVRSTRGQLPIQIGAELASKLT